nr:ammonium transporter [Thermanaeromonas toyohensis]
MTGLFYGDPSQLIAQLIDIAVVFVWGFGISYLFYKVLDKIIGLRVPPEVEEQGLDIPEMGALAYPDFLLSYTEPFSPAHLKQSSTAWARQQQELPARN